MAPLPENNTKRYWLAYTVGPEEHHILMRVAESVTDEAAVSELEGAWGEVAPVLSTDTVFTHVEVAQKGSNVRNIVNIDAPLPGTSPAGGLAEIQRPRSWTVKGRSNDGRRTGVTFFGVNLNTPASWEQDPISTAELAAFRGRMNFTPGMWLSISEQKPNWYNRITVTYNDHWVDQARG